MSDKVQESLKEFHKTLGHFVKRSKTDLVTLQSVACIQILRGVVEKTPIDTGYARGGWQLDIGAWNEPENNTGRDPVMEGLTTLTRLKFGQKVLIGNNVPYIEYLENGSSSQAPTGMMARTLDEVRAQFT